MVEQASEWHIPIFVMDCDVAAAFDHVSHHEIIKTTMDMGVPPILIAAWIREYRISETLVLLDDIVTPGIRRTRSVPQGCPSAADLFGAALDRPARKFMDMRQRKKWGLPVGGGYLGLLLFADNCWTIGMSVADSQTMAREWYELLKQAVLNIDWGEAEWCTTVQDILLGSIAVSVTTKKTKNA